MPEHLSQTVTPARADSRESPTVLILRVLEACNAGCFMCDFANSREPFRFTSAEGQRLAEATKGRIRLVRFTGGEPLIHNEIARLVSHFAERDIATSVITNGAFLLDRCDELVAAGLSQVVLSLDGPTAVSHDRFRQTPGLFDQAIAGITRLRENAPSVRTRVNTVAGPHNVHHLVAMYRLLSGLGVDDWSLIPLKSADGPYRFPQPDRSLAQYHQFQTAVQSEAGPRLIGYSSSWMGADDSQALRYMRGAPPRTPSGECGVVDVLRYYTPRSNTVYACNCVPHRTDGVELGARWRDDLDGGHAADWLRTNGPSRCTGCEPANAALGDRAIDLDDDIFGF